MFRHFNLLVNTVLLFTVPSTSLYPQGNSLQVTPQTQIIDYETELTKNNYAPTYDELINFLHEIESGEIENKCTTREDVERIKNFLVFLARKGALPDGSEESLSLEDDIEELLHGDDDFYEDIFPFRAPTEYRFLITPSILSERRKIVYGKHKTWLSKQLDHITNFAKKHEKELIVAAVVVVAVAAVVVAAVVVGTTAGAAAASAAGAAASSDSGTSDKNEQKDSVSSVPSNSLPMIGAADETSILKSAVEDQIPSFKENIMQQQFFQPASLASQNQELSWEENGRALGSLFAHDSFNNIQNQFPCHPRFFQEVQNFDSNGHTEIDQKFSTDYTHLYANPEKEVDFNTLSYQVRGEKALAYGYLNQAVQDFGKAIEANPTNPLPYLERGVAHFGLGEYDRSLKDYQQFTSQAQKTYPLQVSDFSLGFAKGLPQGIYESGRGLLMFLSDVTVHPIRTGEQMYEAFTLLSGLVSSGEWETIREILAPEVHQLVIEWDKLPSDRRGELVGYVFGKYGTDILVPGVLIKAVSKGLKGAQELNTVYQGLKTAEQMFLLESAAGLESSAKIAEVVQLEKRISGWLGEGTRLIRNEAGDSIFVSKDGLRRVRFDFNRPYPHNNPHAHVEYKVGVDWEEFGQIYPTDVPHN